MYIDFGVIIGIIGVAFGSLLLGFYAGIYSGSTVFRKKLKKATPEEKEVVRNIMNREHKEDINE